MKMIGQLIPDLNNKILGMCFRVPTVDVSVVDMNLKLQKNVTLDDIIYSFKNDANGRMKGIMNWTMDDVVSKDIENRTESCIVDIKASMLLNNNFVKLVAWYDNECGYSNRLIDMIVWINGFHK